MKQNVLKRFLCICFIVFLLSGCSTPQSTDDTGTNETEVKETVAENIENQSSSYRGTQRTLTTTLDGIDKYSIQDKKILGVGYVKDVKEKETTISYYLTSWEETWREEWDEKKQIALPFTTVNYILQCNGLDMDSEGNIYFVLTDSNQNHIYFVEVNASGEIMLNGDIMEILLEDAIISGMTVGSNGKIYLKDSQANVVYELDKQGNLVGTYQLEEGILWDLPKDNNNKVYLITEKKNQLYVNTLLEGEELLFQSNGQNIPINHYMHVYEGFANTFFIPTINGLISYHLDAGTTNQLVDWTLSGINYNTIHYVGIMIEDEEQIITIIAENANKGQIADIYTFEEYDPSEDQYLVLATLGASSGLKNQIIAYNKLHPEYPIQTKTYSGKDEDALRKLNTDLLAGNVVDIIDVNSFRHITSLEYYTEQGLLEDIGAWLEADETIDKNDLFQNILDANKIDGVLYNFVPSFTIDTLAGAKSLVGDDFVWTVEEALPVTENNNKLLYSNQSKEQFIKDICKYNGEYLVNEKEGISYFNSEEFINLLIYANNLPNTIESNKSNRTQSWHQECLLYTANDLALRMWHYYTAKAVFEIGVAQDEMSLVGFPIIDESITNGSVFRNLISISMASTSQKKEQAWGFFQYLLSDYYQNDEREVVFGNSFLKQIGFPIKKSIIQRAMEAQMTEEPLAGFTMYDMIIDYGPATQEDFEIMTNFLYSINRLAWENDTIYNIVWEEAQYYFAGECTAEQAAQRMQNRVELYLMEKE